MSSLDLSLVWNEADSNWDLPRLYADLVKLTELQKALLRAALCGVSLSEVAKKLVREPNGLRADLSAGLYSFIKSLLSQKELQYKAKVCWQQIPRLLESAGYRLLQMPNLNISLESISAPKGRDDSPMAKDIIRSIEEHQLANRLNQFEAKFSKAAAETLDRSGDQAVDQGDYETAIDFYRSPVEQDLTYKAFLVKIAMCFDKLHRYSDAVTLTEEVLPLFTNKDHISKLYGVLGSAYQELAVKTRDEHILRQAVSYYRRALSRSNGPNVLSVWNIFDLLSTFSIFKETEDETYLRKAKLAFCDFKDVTRDPRSNFQRYRQKILADALRIQMRINDQWIKDELKSLITL